MKLKYSHNKNIIWIADFLPKNTYQYIHNFCVKNRNKINQTTELSEKWVRALGHKDTKSLYDFNKNILNTYHTLLRHQAFVDFRYAHLDSHFRKTGPNENLSWHSDESGSRLYAATLYLNKNWHENWGGELLFKVQNGDDLSCGYIPFTGNSLVLVKTGV